MPRRFVHRSCVLGEIADVTYMTSSYYDREIESGVALDDREVAIQWPGQVERLASERNRAAQTVGAAAPSFILHLRRLTLGAGD